MVWLLATARNAVIVILGGTLAYGLYAAGMEPFTLTGEVEPGLPSFALPEFSFEYGNTTVTTGEIFGQLSSGLAVVPLIGMLENIVIAKAFARKNQYKIDPTQELLAIGTANILGSFVSAYPVTGSFSRTAVNSQSSVKTPAGGVVTGVLVLLALSLLSATFKFIPQATLAAVIICAVASMFEYEIVPHLWKTKKIDMIPLALTFFACLFIGIEYGILAGVGISIIFLLYHMARPDLTIVSADMFLGENAGLSKADAANHNMHVSRVSDSIVIQPGISLYFPSTTYLIDTVSKCSTREDIPNPVIFDCTHISGTDFTTVQGFKQIVEEFESRNQPIIFCCMLAPILCTVESAHIKGFRHCQTVVEAYNIMAGQLSKLKDNTSRAALLHNSDTQNTMVSTASGDFDDRVESINSPVDKVHWDIDNDASYLPFARDTQVTSNYR